MSDARPPTYLTLDAMRGVAALAVVLFHGVDLFGTVAPRGYLAVDLFFVLSGFVIAHAYDKRFARGMTTREFVTIRVIRFYPLYIAGLALGLVRELLLIATHNGFAVDPARLLLMIVTAALFLPCPLATRAGNLFPINVPSWSLFFELLVNVLYALLLVRLGKRTLVAVALVSGVALVALTPPSGLGEVGVTSHTVAGGAARTLFSFTLGLLLRRAALRGPTLPATLLLAVTAILFAVPSGGRLYDLAFALVLGPLLVLLGSSTQPSPAILAFARRLGLLSFPIYAVHRPVLLLAEGVAHAAHLPGLLVGGAALAVLIVVCAFLADPVDRRVRARLSALVGERTRIDPAERAAP